jgi:hypothetical protein
MIKLRVSGWEECRPSESPGILKNLRWSRKYQNDCDIPITIIFQFPTR